MTRKRRASLWLLPMLAIIALLAVACGDDDDDDDEPADTPATSAASAEATTPAASPSATSAPAEKVKVKMQMNWFPQPENAGELAAATLGYFPENVEVEVNPGGPGIAITQLLATGEVEFATCGADSILIAKEKGINLVGLLAAFQSNPQILYSHAEAGVKGFEDMVGKPVAVSDGAVYYDFLAKKYGWSDSDKRKYDGAVATFLANKDLIQQGYYTSEPYFIAKEAPDTKFDTFLIADSGYNPYSSLLCTTQEYLDENPEVVKAVVEGAQKGWQDLVDPTKNAKVLEAIMEANPDHTPESMAFAVEKMPDLMFNADTEANGFGSMTDERWKTLMDQMVDLGVLKAPVDYKSVFTNEFIVK